LPAIPVRLRPGSAAHLVSGTASENTPTTTCAASWFVCHLPFLSLVTYYSCWATATDDASRQSTLVRRPTGAMTAATCVWAPRAEQQARGIALDGHPTRRSEYQLHHEARSNSSALWPCSSASLLYTFDRWRCQPIHSRIFSARVAASRRKRSSSAARQSASSDGSGRKVSGGMLISASLIRRLRRVFIVTISKSVGRAFAGSVRSRRCDARA
jgi:hypothetical protein